MGVNAQKQAVVAELKEKLTTAKGAVFTSYKGLTVAQDTELRRALRAAGVSYHVVKNTMTRIAAKEAGLDEICGHLEGTTALAVSTEDAVAPAKTICEFIKKNKLEEAGILTLKAGLLENTRIGCLRSEKSLRVSYNINRSKFCGVGDVFCWNDGLFW